MRIVRQRLLALPALALLLAAAWPMGERLASAPLPGFKTGHEASNAKQSIREEIPAGETVLIWTRMITTQRFGGLARQVSPEQYLSNVVDGLEKSCPEARWTPIRSHSLNSRNAAKFMADCPNNPQTGLPETFVILAVAGANDMLVKQIAFRKDATLAERQWAERYLAKVRYCGAGNRTPACN